MSTTSDSRPPTKGVEFSDHLIVLGASPSPSTSQTYSHALPKAQAFVQRGHVTTKEMAIHVHEHHRDKPTSISPHFQYAAAEHDDSTPFHISPSLPYRTPGKRRARLFEHAPELISDDMVTPPRAYDEPVETSCTDSEEDQVLYPNQTNQNYSPRLQDTVERCTRIKTKLNSLPSGGAFSLMNSSEDVDLSSSDDEQLASSRKLVRVDGSAKLSTASGFGEESFDVDEDEFAIEGAERVDEEEAVNVRSFGRSFARVCLKDDMDDVELHKPTKWETNKSQVAFDIPADEVVAEEKAHRVEDGLTSDSAAALSAPSAQKKVQQKVLTESRSAPPRRKSRLRLTFVRRASIADTKESKPDRCPKAATASNVLDDSVSGVKRLSCFPMRRSPTKQRSKSGDISRPGLLCGTHNSRDNPSGKLPPVVGGTNQVVAIPEFDLQNSISNTNRKNRKMVKNISMQRDDWIDFATNSPHRQRSQWLARFIPSSGADSEVSSRRDSRATVSEVMRHSRNTGWKLWRFWNRK